jgi:hypothetical protein
MINLEALAKALGEGAVLLDNPTRCFWGQTPGKFTAFTISIDGKEHPGECFDLLARLNDGMEDMVYKMEWTGVCWIVSLGKYEVVGGTLTEAIVNLFIEAHDE